MNLTQRVAGVVALTALFCIGAAAAVTEVALGDKVFPESITSTSDGTLFIGSLGQGVVLKAAPGAAAAQQFIAPGSNGLNKVFGVLADEKSKTLWVCSGSLPPSQGEVALKTFDLKTGAAKGSYPVPPDGGAFCNDIAIAKDGTAYMADTFTDRLLMLKPGAKALELVMKDSLLAGADGLVFAANGTSLYVNSFTTGKLLRVDLGADGKGTKVTEVTTSRKLERPDGMRPIGQNRFLMIEGVGRLDMVTIGSDPGMATVTTLKEGFDGPTAVTPLKNTAWVIEGKLNYLTDPKMKDQNPGAFKAQAVPFKK